MKFCEAMDKLKSGSKVTRQSWKGDVYFFIIGGGVKSFQSRLSPYLYDGDIMVSDGWIVSNQENEHKFCDIMPFLLEGSQAKFKDWSDTFIYLDQSTKTLVIKSMEIFPFIPDFASFIAEDWIEL